MGCSTINHPAIEVHLWKPSDVLLISQQWLVAPNPIATSGWRVMDGSCASGCFTCAGALRRHDFPGSWRMARMARTLPEKNGNQQKRIMSGAVDYSSKNIQNIVQLCVIFIYNMVGMTCCWPLKSSYLFHWRIRHEADGLSDGVTDTFIANGPMVDVGVSSSSWG